MVSWCGFTTKLTFPIPTERSTTSVTPLQLQVPRHWSLGVFLTYVARHSTSIAHNFEIRCVNPFCRVTPPGFPSRS